MSNINYAVNPSQMGEWNQICKAFAKKVGAELLFVNEESCGIQYPNGAMQHVYIDEMVEYLRSEETKGKQNENNT